MEIFQLHVEDLMIVHVIFMNLAVYLDPAHQLQCHKKRDGASSIVYGDKVSQIGL